MNGAQTMREQEAVNSLHTGDVPGSIPGAPTNLLNGLGRRAKPFGGVNAGSREPYAREIRPIRIVGDVAYVPLSRGLEAIIDTADVPLVELRNWHAVRDTKTFYAAAPAKRGEPAIKMHRLICPTEPPYVVDHINGNGLDNRRANLRQATPSQNQQNQARPKAGASGVVGVHWHRGKWAASIKVGGKRKHLGRFTTKEEAVMARRQAEQALWDLPPPPAAQVRT